MKKTIAISIITATLFCMATIATAETKNKQTVIVQTIQGIKGFAIQSDPEWVKKTIKEYPESLTIGEEFKVEYYCAEKNEVGTIYTPGKCK